MCKAIFSPSNWKILFLAKFVHRTSGYRYEAWKRVVLMLTIFMVVMMVTIMMIPGLPISHT